MSELTSLQTPPSNQQPVPKSQLGTKILIGILTVLLITATTLAVVYYQQIKSINEDTVIEELEDANGNEEDLENDDLIDSETDESEVDDTKKDDTKEDDEETKYPKKKEKITFNFLNSPSSIRVVDIFSQEQDEYGHSSYNVQMENSKAWQFGEIEGGKYDEGKLIIQDIGIDGPIFYPIFVRLIQLPNDDIVVLDKYSNLDFQTDNSKFTVDYSFSLNELEAPQTLNLGASNKIVHLVEDMPALFESENKIVFYTDSDNRKVYTDKMFESTSARNGFYLKLVDGTQVSYEYKPRFIPENKIPNFSFNGGIPNTREYEYISVEGCGASNLAKLVNRRELNTSVIVGITSTGSDIYAPTLDNNYLREYYQSYYPPYGEEKPSYSQFSSDYPILFFEDPFGRIVVMTSSMVLPAGECGKPVIYLYPEKTSKISVKVKPKGGFTYTEPDYYKYGEGWNVMSTPNSKMFEIEDKNKTIYPYLFWEGRGGIYEAPEQGFLVKRENVDKFLTEKMKYMSFNSTEINDFKEFWLPRMQEFKYYKISFMGNRAMDQLAPLEILPKPDTVIRMLMDFTGYDKPVKVKKQILIKGPERKGFTVTEWGGVIQ